MGEKEKLSAHTRGPTCRYTTYEEKSCVPGEILEGTCFNGELASLLECALHKRINYRAIAKINGPDAAAFFARQLRPPQHFLANQQQSSGGGVTFLYYWKGLICRCRWLQSVLLYGVWHRGARRERASERTGKKRARERKKLFFRTHTLQCCAAGAKGIRARWQAASSAHRMTVAG